MARLSKWIPATKGLKFMANVRISLAFRRAPDTGLYEKADGVRVKLTGNPNFPDLPVDLADLAAVINNFQTAIQETKQGGSVAQATKQALRLELIGQLRKLAAYVQLESGEDEAKALSSGFDLASRNTAQTELAVPPLLAITNLNSTQLGLKIKPVRNAKVYEVWLRTKDRDWWLAQTFPNTRGMVLKNLVPGTLYDIRLRAVGGSTGYSPFGEVFQPMST